jgi:hypothetical protein
MILSRKIEIISRNDATTQRISNIYVAPLRRCEKFFAPLGNGSKLFLFFIVYLLVLLHGNNHKNSAATSVNRRRV